MSASADSDSSTSMLQAAANPPSEFVETVVGIEPYDYQKAVLDAESDRVAFVSGRQVGKSRTAAWTALHHALTHSGHTVLITAPYRRQSSEIFKQVKHEMSESDIPDKSWGKERETRTVIEFDNGSRILSLPTGDDGSNIRGYTANLIVADEAAFIDDNVFNQVLTPMLAATDGDMVLLSTPYGASGFLHDAFNDNLDDDYFTKQVPSYQSPNVGQDFIATQQRQLSSIEFKQEILGKFEESAKAFFESDNIEAAQDRVIEGNTRERYLGVDPARHGEDRFVCTMMDGEARVSIEAQEKSSDITECIGQIKDLHDEWQFDQIAIDETALGGGVVDILREDLSRGTVNGVTFSRKKKQELYQSLKSRVENGEISLPDNDRLRTQMLDLEYEFTSGGKMKVEPPDSGHDDFPDSLTLANWALKQGSKVRQTGSVSM